MKNRVFRSLMGGLALFSLAVCLIMGVLIFLGRVSDATYKKALTLVKAFLCANSHPKV